MINDIFFSQNISKYHPAQSPYQPVCVRNKYIFLKFTWILLKKGIFIGQMYVFASKNMLSSFSIPAVKGPAVGSMLKDQFYKFRC